MLKLINTCCYKIFAISSISAYFSFQQIEKTNILYSIFPFTIFHRKTRDVFYDYVLINWNPEIYR